MLTRIDKQFVLSPPCGVHRIGTIGSLGHNHFLENDGP